MIDVADIVKGTPFEKQAGGGGNQVLGPQRLQLMDKTGVDVQALTINGFWWYGATDRDLAGRIVKAQNEGLAKWVSTHPQRFVAMASVALQHPDLAAQQLEDGVTRLGLRGASIGGHVNGEDLSLPKYDPFWAKAAELGVPVVMHPGGADNILKEGALRGRADLGNIIGNPLETTYFLSRLIFDGTFDKFPGLRVCAHTPVDICRPTSDDRKRRAKCGTTRIARTRRSPASTEESGLHRHDGVLGRRVAASRRRGGREPGRLRNRRSVQLAGNGGSSPQREVPE